MHDSILLAFTVPAVLSHTLNYSTPASKLRAKSRLIQRVINMVLCSRRL